MRFLQILYNDFLCVLFFIFKFQVSSTMFSPTIDYFCCIVLSNCIFICFLENNCFSLFIGFVCSVYDFEFILMKNKLEF